MSRNNLRINEEGGRKYLVLSEALGTRVKILNFIYFVLFTAIALTILYLFILDGFKTATAFIILIFAFSLYSLIAYRFINKALKTEYLIVENNELTIFKGGFLNKSEQTFEIDKITFFRHLDKPILAKHTLAGESLDYLGFETISKLTNELYGDNRLAFEYEGKTVTFGENVYSWDFEKIEAEIF